MNDREQEKEKRERAVTERFLHWYNCKHGAAVEIICKPDGPGRRQKEGENLPDFLCREQAHGSPMMIEVGVLASVSHPGQRPVEKRWRRILANLEEALDERVAADGLSWAPIVLLRGSSVAPPPEAPTDVQGLLSAAACDIVDRGKRSGENRKDSRPYPLVGGYWEGRVLQQPRPAGAKIIIVQASPAQGKQKASYDPVPDMLLEAHGKLGWRPNLAAKRVLVLDCREWLGWHVHMQRRGQVRGSYTPGCKLLPALRRMETWRRNINSKPESERAAYEEGLRNMGLKFTPVPPNWNIDEIHCLGPDWVEKTWREGEQWRLGPIEQLEE